MGDTGIVAAIRRNAILFAVLVIVAVAAAAGVYLTIPKPYQAQTQLVLLSPSIVIGADGKPTPINPFSQAGDNASQVTASALANIAASDAFRSSLADAGVTSSTTVAVATTGGGVVLQVATVSPRAAIAEKDLLTLTTQLQQTLLDQQQSVGAPANSLLQLKNLTGNAPAQPQAANRTKLAGVAGVLGLLVSVMVVMIADGRRRRRAVSVPAKLGRRARKRAEKAHAKAAAKPTAAPVTGGLAPADSSDRSAVAVASGERISG